MSSSTPSLGEVASAASGDTVFRIAPSTGAITKQSGNGARVSTGTSRATVTISCGNDNACNNDDVYIRVGAGSVTGRAKALTNFTVSMGTATLKTAASGTNPINFRIGPIGKNSSKTFYVGADFPIGADGTGSTGNATASFYVWADDVNPPNGSQSGSGTAVATVFRSLSLTKNSDLAFGRIVKPVSGGAVTVGLAAADASKTVPAGVAWLNLPLPTRASFSVSGEGGQTLAITVPSTFTMTGPSASSLTVTTNTFISGGNAQLSSILGNSGSLNFFVGGSFPISPTTRNGTYSGTFAVTVAYN
ncbi:DUF4402 domain-containing protein [Phenylobacterium sp. J367]|uniref:DUF4402 domain-containing protein n=1 Tax=Phenylobacterium sp. J367 TaxID=2898435 RepID=UPI002151C06A|nr:DUF4402 domain-containing protein [Phenylobacterium sp. J367]MCR5880546.1 DUF4402 domain-containing protein [Phenylobacterium sp. J367]